MFRTQLTPGDPLRDFTALFSQAGDLTGVTLISPDGTRYAQTLGVGGDPLATCDRLVRVPAGGVPGRWSIDGDGRDFGAVEVVAPPKPLGKPHRFTPADATPAAVEHFSTTNVLHFAPGRYEFERQIVIPPNPIWLAEGAVFVGRPDIKPAPGHPAPTLGAMFTGGANATIVGAEFRPAGGLVFHSPVVLPGLVLDRCTAYDGVLAWGYGQVLFQYLTLVRCAVDGAPSGLHLGCEHRGRPPGDWEVWRCGATDGETWLVDATFDGTPRGPGFSTGAGDVPYSRVHNLACRHIIPSLSNGGEILYAEGGTNPGELADFLWTKTELHGCCGDMLQFSSAPTRRGRVWGLRSDGPGRICLLGTDGTRRGGVPVEGLSIEQFEVAGIVIGSRDNDGYQSGRVAGNTFRDGAVIRRPPSRRNQPYAPYLYEPARLPDPERDAEEALNTLENVRYVGWRAEDAPWGNLRRALDRDGRETVEVADAMTATAALAIPRPGGL